MADPIKFSELGNVGELSSSALVAIVQQQNGELVSLKCTVAEIAQLIVNGIEFSGLTSNDKKIIGAINEIVAKVDDLELFKFPNVTIIGAPTINHGQISGFSSADYLKFPFLVDFHGQPFEINMAFTTGANVTQQENIFDSDYGLAFAIRNGHFVIAISTNGTTWDLGEGVGSLTVLPGTTYFVRLSWDGSTYKLAYSLDGTSYTDDIVKAGTSQPFPRQIYIGVGENFASVVNHFAGTINLNKADLRIAGEVVWLGMDDAGLSTRADISLSNIDAAGEQRIKDIAGRGGGGGNVDDVQINGESILDDNKVANIPYATAENAGVIKVGNGLALDVNKNASGTVYSASTYINRGGSIIISKGTLENIKSDYTKRALTDESQPAWTEEDQAKAKATLGILSADVTKAYVDEQDDAIRTNVTRLDEQINGNAVALVIIDGEYSRSSDGRIVTYEGWSRTDYTDVRGLSMLEYSYNGADSRYNCFYDENKTFITSFNISATESGSVTVPSNAKYFVVSATTEDMASFRWLNGQTPGIADEVTAIRAEIDSLEKVEVKDLQVSSLVGQTGSNRETIIGNHIYYHLGFSAKQVIPAGSVLFTGTPHKLDSKNIAWTTYLGDVATFDFNKNGTITNALQIAQGKAFFIDFVVV